MGSPSVILLSSTGLRTTIFGVVLSSAPGLSLSSVCSHVSLYALMPDMVVAFSQAMLPMNVVRDIERVIGERKP